MKRRGTVRKLLRYVRPYGWLCALTLLTSVCAVAATLYAPVLIGKAVDVVADSIPALDTAALLARIGELALTVAVATVFTYLQRVLAGSIAYRVTRDLRADCTARLAECSVGFVDTVPHGDILARVGVDAEIVGDGLLQGVLQLFSGVTTIAGTIGFMVWLDWRTALVVICITPLSLLVAALIARHAHKVFAAQSKLRGELGALCEEAFSNAELVRVFGYDAHLLEAFDDINRRLDRIGTQAQFASAMSNPCTRFVNSIVYAAVAVCGCLAIVANPAGAMTVGTLASFLAYANQYTKPFNEISAVATELQSAYASADRCFSLTELEPEPETGNGILPEAQGDVTMRDVTFGYTPERTLMRGLDLTVRRGMRVAIVGPTGCGKSTLINLLMRFYDPQTGTIAVDGTDIATVSRGSVRAAYGMVLQETWLASATIAENIAYGRPDATREEIVAAAKAAHCHRFVELLPNGYDTPIDEDDTGLSVGQKQLLCIARVMLISPPMLILDEATSNIDTRTERRIQRGFAALTRDKTAFIVAHRFSTIVDADLILVMRDGTIVEQGTHESLLAENGFYASLYRAQFE